MICASLLLLLPILASGHSVYKYQLQPQPYNTQLAYNRPANKYVFNRPSYTAQVPAARVNVPVSSPYVPVSPYTFTRSSVQTNDVVTETQTQAANLIKILTKFSYDQRVVDFVTTNYGNSPCVNNLQEAITATQFASDLITRSGPQLRTLINKYNQLKNEKNAVVLLRGAATLLQTLDALVPKLADLPLSTQCRNSPEAIITGMKDLARIISGLATSPENNFPAHARQTLQQSVRIVDASTDFVAGIRNIFNNNDKFCTLDSQYNTQAVDALGQLFNEVDKLLKAVGSNIDISAIKQNNLVFARGLVDNLNQLQKSDIGFLDCNIAGSYKGTAETLLEVSEVVEEIGLENLERQLGIKFNLEF